MKEIYTLINPFIWSVKNDITGFKLAFYKKTFFYVLLGIAVIFLVMESLAFGMTKLQNLSPEVFKLLLEKGYSIIFIIVFFILIVNGFVVSLNTFYQSRDLEILLVSPVNRTSLFLAKLFESYVKTLWMLFVFGLPVLAAPGILNHAEPWYYIYAGILLAAFSVIPVNIGSGLSMVFSGLFHVRKLKRTLLSAGIVIAVVLTTVLRLFRPERFVNPELFANLTIFLSEIKTPSHILLPNRWLSGAIFDAIGNNFSLDAVLYILLLISTGYITSLLLYLLFKRYHYRGWEIFQEGEDKKKSYRKAYESRSKDIKEPFVPDTAGIPALVSGSKIRALIWKDFLCQTRDPKNVHNGLIFLSLVIIYLFSISAIPLNWEGYSRQLKYIISFFNLGLILIITAALCSRIVYPAAASEGAALWVIKTSPITAKRYLWTKFVFFFIPLFVVGQMLVLLSSILIRIENQMTAINSLTTAAASSALVSIALASGISDFRYSTGESVKDIKTSSAVQMLVSVFLILLTLALVIIPAVLYYFKEPDRVIFTPKALTALGASIFLLFIVNILATAFSMRLGIKRLDGFYDKGR